MHLSDFLAPDAMATDLRGESADAVLGELVALLGLEAAESEAILTLLRRREAFGSTGVGRGIAIPHCRTLAIPRVRLADGHHRGGLEYHAIDQQPVFDFFLIVAPPAEVSHQYLPVLAKVAQLAKEPDVPERLAAVRSLDDLLRLLRDKGV